MSKLGLRTTFRSLALEILGMIGYLSGSTARGLAEARVQIIYLHGVESEDVGRFRELIAFLTDSHTIVPYSRAVDLISSGNIDRPYLAIAFDDGFVSDLNASAVLNEFDIKAIHFVCTAIVGMREGVELDRAFEIGFDVPSQPVLSWEQVDSLRRDGHEIGCHTSTHPDLGTISSDALESEIAGARQELTRRGIEADHFAWPFGRLENFSAVAREAVWSAGFKSCASAIRGVHTGDRESRPMIYREHVDASWPIRHVKYLLARSVNRRLEQTAGWPSQLSQRI